MLLDYKAVGVELVMPTIEFLNFKDWASYSKSTKMTGRSNYSNNYTFSPKVNCQDQLVNYKLPQ